MEEIKKYLKAKHSEYNNELILLREKLATLPKGAVTKRKIGNQYYFYLSCRKDGKLRHEYLGKDEPVQLLKDVSTRRETEQRLREVKKTLQMLRTVRPKIV